MSTPTRFALLAACLTLPLLSACAMSDELDSDEPSSTRAVEVAGASYVITPSTSLSNAQIQSLAEFIEAQGEDVQGAKIMVHADEEGAAPVIEVEMWAGELPGDEFGDALRAEFEFLTDALVEVVALDEEMIDPMPDYGIEPGDDAETIEQKVTEELRAEGVEGEIEVTVTVTDDGHHAIEVNVEKHE